MKDAVMVTGAAGGIGRAIVERLVAGGLAVHACDIAGMDDLVGRGDVATYRCDVGHPAQVDRLASAVQQAVEAGEQRLTAVVNGAGINESGDLSTTSVDQWERTLRVNLTGTFLVTRAMLPLLADPGGTIVVIASDQAMRPRPSKLAYGESKAGLVQIARQIALDLAPGIRSICISPGPVDTAMLRDAGADVDLSRVPLERAADPEEVAALVAFSISDEARFLTGANLVLDGGTVIAP